MAYHPIPGQSGSGSSPSPSSRLHYLNNSQFGDTTFTKVFVGGLAWETQSETMRHYFVQFGEILEAVVITDKNTGRSKGYGFVTFRDPEAARRACADPTPIIDGRRANCNLASLGRPRLSLPLGRMRSPNPIIGNSRVTIGGFGYQQSVPFAYQQGYVYSLYGYSPYGPDYNYSQGLYNPYMNQQYLQLYGVPGTGSPSMYPNYGQLGHSSATVQGSALQGYTVPGHQIFQYSGGSSNASTISSIPSVQSPYHAGLVTSGPTQPQFIISAHSPQFLQGGTSDQASG